MVLLGSAAGAVATVLVNRRAMFDRGAAWTTVLMPGDEPVAVAVSADPAALAVPADPSVVAVTVAR